MEMLDLQLTTEEINILIVDTKKEILETDWSNLEGTSDNRLTLITCIKNKVNQRLCVQAVQESI